MKPLFPYRTFVEREVKRRINVAVWAYAYEIENASIVDDHKFDAECRKINSSISTNRPHLDEFFRTTFQSDTGMWIHHHPELAKVAEIYRRYYTHDALHGRY